MAALARAAEARWVGAAPTAARVEAAESVGLRELGQRVGSAVLRGVEAAGEVARV